MVPIPMTHDMKRYHGNMLRRSLMGDQIEGKTKSRNNQIGEMGLHELIILNLDHPFTPPLPYNF